MATISKKLLYTAIAGAVILVIGLIMAFVGFPLIVDDQIHKQVRLENGTDGFERWKELPVAIHFNVYLFHVENWKEVTFEGAYPKVVEYGPYAYKQYRRKTNIDYNDNDDSLTYNQYTHFEFDPKASGERHEDEEIVILNAGLNAIFQIASRYIPGFLLSYIIDPYWINMFPEALNKTMFIKARVGDVIFDGYRFCEPKEWSVFSGIMCIVAGLLDIPFLELQDDLSIKFSFFNFKQDAHDGIFTVHAGNKDITKLGRITQWNGDAYNNIWGERMSHCNKIQGTDGTIYPPNLSKDEALTIFTTEICRAVKAEYDGEEVVSGITTQRRVLTFKMLADPDEYPENACYCTKHERNLYGENKCLPNGFSDISPCYIAPLIASFPHFLDGDEDYIKTVEGLTPSVDKHRSVFNLEPISGIPIRAKIRLQFNMILRPISGITVTQKITPNISPVTWIEMSVTLPEGLVGQFRSLLNLAVVDVEVIKWLIVAIGGCMFLICGGLYIYKIKKQKAKM